MDNRLLAVFVVVIALSGIVSAGAVSIVDPSASEEHLSIMPTHYEPYPAESGRYVKLWIKVENIDSTAAHNVKLLLDSSYPFSFDATETGERSAGTIEPGKQVVLEYNLRVDSLALTSVYNKSLSLRWCYNSDCTSYASYPIEISVRRPNPIIELASLALSPETIEAGKPFNLTMILRSSGSRIKDITASLDLTDVPFGPFGSSKEKQIQSIESDGNSTVQFSLIATGAAASGVYKIPLELAYYDEVGNSFTKSDIVTLMVGGKPDIYIVADENTNLRKDSATEFSVNVVNKGLVDVKLMKIVLLSSEDYKILSPDSVYIGDLESDNYENAKFKIYVNGAPEQMTLSFNVTYMDSLNKQYNEIKGLTYTVMSKDDAVRFGLDKADTGWIYLAILAILVVYAIYRVKKKKK